MTIVLFDPDLVISRVAGQVTAFKIVQGSADFAASAAGLVTPPSAFVLPLSDRPSANQTATIVSQQNTIRFGVALAVQNLRDPRGEQATADLRTLRIAVMTALLGWSPAAEYDPCEYGGGRLLQLTDQVLWWQDDFVTRLFLRSS
jgi:hypothetical protein